MAGPPRICVVVESTAAGGDARFLLDLCRFVDRRRVGVDVVCLGGAGPLAAALERCDAPVQALDRPDGGGLWAAGQSVGSLLALFNRLRHLRPDIVHTVGVRAGVLGRLAARLAGIPGVVATIRRSERGPGLWPLLARATAPLVDLHVATAESLAAEAVFRYGAHPSRVVVVGPGVDLGRLAGERPAAVGPGRPVIGTLARLVPEKGIDVLLEAAAILVRYHPGLQVVIAGTGPLGEDCRRQARRLGLEHAVTFAGDCENAGALLAALDVFVLGAGDGGCSQALLEALAAGTPSVAARGPGIAGIVDDGATALLVPPGHAALLADAIDRLLVDRELAARLSAAGRRLVQEKFQAAGMGAAWQAIYERLVGGTVEPAGEPRGAAFPC